MAWSLDLGKLVKPLGDLQDNLNLWLAGGDKKKLEENKNKVAALQGDTPADTETVTPETTTPDTAETNRAADRQTESIAAGLSGLKLNRYGSQGRAQSAAYGAADSSPYDYVAANKQLNRDRAFMNAVNAGQTKLTAAQSSLDAGNLATAAELQKQSQGQQDFANLISTLSGVMYGVGR